MIEQFRDYSPGYTRDADAPDSYVNLKSSSVSRPATLFLTNMSPLQKQ